MIECTNLTFSYHTTSDLGFNVASRAFGTKGPSHMEPHT